MATTIQIIAELLRADQQEAERFLREAQSYFPEPVPEGTIIQLLRKRRDSDLTAEEVASILKKEASSRAASTTSRPTRDEAGPDADQGLNPDVQPAKQLNRRGDPGQHTEKMDRCEHGVLLGRPCAICRRLGRTHDK